MKQFIKQRVRIEKDVIIRINRILQGKSIINVAVGQQVKPSDIIGTGDISSGFRTLNLASLLSVSPKEIHKYLKRDVGQRIYKGELLAYKDGGLFGGKKWVVAPTDGLLDFLNPQDGKLKMTLLPKKIELPAGVYGIVESVDKEKGKVTIRTQASRVHGIIGCGRLRDGILEFIGQREDFMVNTMISPKSEGHILVGGSLIYKDALSSAISCGVGGIIIGGINAKDYRAMAGGRLVFPKKLENDIGVSVVVCEGFGSIPIALDIYNLLLKYKDSFVSIDGNIGVINLPSFESSSLAKVKATNLPLETDSDEYISKSMVLSVGVWVRIIGNSYLGEQGKVIAIDESPTLMSSGLSAILATIETKRRKVKVPVVNLEAIEYI